MRSRFRIVGRVQGVGFRAFVMRSAMPLGVHGGVRNEPDGSVMVDVEGDSGSIEVLERALAIGPPAARVDAVESLEPEAGESSAHDAVF